MIRANNRHPDELRPVAITRSFLKHAEGSCLIEWGHTKVICSATVEEQLPGWMRGQKRGWVTAEYGMLPRATHERTQREASRGKQGGRTLEIQRLIGRAMRAVVDLTLLGERTIWIDCDVIQADGGTRTAAITGAYIAMTDACHQLHEKGRIDQMAIVDAVAAVSCGIVDGKPLLDLDYLEDSNCETDMNFVMTGSGRFVEIQGTAERTPFSREDFQMMSVLAEKGIHELVRLQQQVLLRTH